MKKIDLDQKLTQKQLPPLKEPIVRVSSLTGDGIGSLNTLLLGELADHSALEQDGAFLSNFRQKQQVEEALKAAKG